MSKYEPLWKWIGENRNGAFSVTFDEIGSILGFPLDHAFLSFKKELTEYGFLVKKISMKDRIVFFEKAGG